MDRVRGRASMGNCRSRKLDVCVSVVIFETFIGCVLLAYTAFASPTTKYDTLQQVVFLFRHGDRTPTKTYPKDPYINYPWPGGWGALTKKGMLELYDMGQWIRREYGKIIGNKFESAATMVHSSDMDRCIMSAQALLAALFVPSPEDMFLPGLEWTPVPIHTIPKNLDKLISMKAPCPRLTEALKQTFFEASNSSEMAAYFKELTEHTGQNMSTFIDIFTLYDTLEIEEQHGLQLPEWTRKFYNNEMREIAIRSMALFTNNTLQKRLIAGPLLKKILLDMEEIRIDSNQKRSYFYSAHDQSIVSMLRTMGFTNERLKPDYGATLIFELHLSHNSADQEVKILYLNNTKIRIAQPLEIPNCASPCSLQTLKQIWHEVIPIDWDAECII